MGTPDSLEFEEGFETNFDFTEEPSVSLEETRWQMKQVAGFSMLRRFKIDSVGQLWQKDDEGWIRRKNTEEGRFYSGDYKFRIKFKGGVVQEIKPE